MAQNDQTTLATDVIEPQTALAAVAERNGLAPAVAAALVTTFVPLAEQAAGLIADAERISVTNATQVTEIKQARAARLKLKAIRVEIEDARKGLKEESLRRGKAIDAVAGYLRERIEPVETRLENQEKFAERKEAERKAWLKLDREALLRPFADPTYYDLSNMPESAWVSLLDSSRLAHEARAAAAAKVEADRLAAEAARVEEEKRVRAENERLRQEAVAAERAAKAERERMEAEARARDSAARVEREKAEVALRAEREAREKLEREAVALEAAEAKRLADEDKARKAAERAPDKAKIRAVATAVRAIQMPSVKSAEASVVLTNVFAKVESFAAWIEQQAEVLS